MSRIHFPGAVTIGPSTFLLNSLIVICFSVSTWAQEGSQKRAPSGPPAADLLGRRTFVSRCAGCHGLGGKGGERAPNIATNPKVQGRSDSELFRTISNGLPDFGMPAFRLLGTAELNRVVAYLRVLQGRNAIRHFPGDPQKGRALFFSKVNCSTCHRAQGEGRFLGSDLSSYADGRTPEEIRQAITDPPSSSATRIRTAVVQARDGREFTGTVRNEDNFSLQLQSEDGTFHLLMKSELLKVEFRSPPAMPTDYGNRLTSKELDDLVSYLHNLKAVEDFDSAGTDPP